MTANPLAVWSGSFAPFLTWTIWSSMGNLKIQTDISFQTPNNTLTFPPAECAQTRQSHWSPSGSGVEVSCILRPGVRQKEDQHHQAVFSPRPVAGMEMIVMRTCLLSHLSQYYLQQCARCFEKFRWLNVSFQSHNVPRRYSSSESSPSRTNVRKWKKRQKIRPYHSWSSPVGSPPVEDCLEELGCQ